MRTAVQAMSKEDQINYVWGGTDEGDADLYRKYIMGTDIYDSGISGLALSNMITNAGQLLTSIYVASQGQAPWLKEQGINSPEDIYTSKGVGAVLESGLAWAQEAQRDNTQLKIGMALKEVRDRIMAVNEGATESSVNEAAMQVIQEIIQSVTSPTGRVDVDAFNKKVKQYVEESE